MLYDMGHLARYPMALGNLGDLEEISHSVDRPPPKELFTEAVEVNKRCYNNQHVYPYTYKGGYLYKQKAYKEALRCWADASYVIRNYNYQREDEEIYKEFLEIARDSIPHVAKIISAENKPFNLTELTLLQDPECYADFLRFYDGICEWEEGSSTPVLHITWAKQMVFSLSKFDPLVRNFIDIMTDGGDEEEESSPSNDGSDTENEQNFKPRNRCVVRSCHSNRAKRSKLASVGSEMSSAGEESVKEMNKVNGNGDKEIQSIKELMSDSSNMCVHADRSNPNMVAGDGSNPNMVTGDGSNPNMVTGDGSNPNIVAGDGSNPNMVAGDGSNHNMVAGDGSNPNMVTSDGSNPNMVTSDGSNPNMVTSDGSNPNMMILVQAGDASSPNMVALAQACGDSILNPDFLLSGGEPFTSASTIPLSAPSSDTRVDFNEFLSTKSNGTTFVGMTMDSMLKAESPADMMMCLPDQEIAKLSPMSDGSTEPLNLPVATLCLRSEKMKGLRKIFTSPKLNMNAIKLQLTAQSQVQVRHKTIFKTDSDIASSRKRGRRD